jgi:hypothetical protein
LELLLKKLHCNEPSALFVTLQAVLGQDTLEQIVNNKPELKLIALIHQFIHQTKRVSTRTHS